jgi:hypothetical protein
MLLGYFAFAAHRTGELVYSEEYLDQNEGLKYGNLEVYLGKLEIFP